MVVLLMKNAKRQIAIFDFDGTITSKDTFVEFVKFVFGLRRMVLAFLLYSPIIALMKVGLYSRGKAKQMLFSHFFKGMEYKRFKKHGEAFAEKIQQFTKADVLKLIKTQQGKGSRTYVISASITEWVKPFCDLIGIDSVIATEVEVDNNGFLSGRFKSKNCFGKEKVNRFLKIEPHRNDYFLFVCGDSKGDYEMVNLADEGIII